MKILHIGILATGYPFNALQRALFNACDGKYDEVSTATPDLAHQVQKRFAKLQPDLVFMQLQGANIVPLWLCDEMKNKAIVVNWSGDVRHPLPPWYVDTAPHVHSTMFSNETDCELLRQSFTGTCRADYIQVGYDHTVYTPDQKKVTVPDIIFCANNYGNLFPNGRLRKELAESLKAVFGSRFLLSGSGWPGAIKHVNEQKESQLYANCKIAINCSHFDYKRYSSDRMFRIMGAGALCLTHRFPDFDMDFIEGGNVACWSTVSELIEKCKYYLSPEHELERKQIAASGHQVAFKNHTYCSMVSDILEVFHQLNPGYALEQVRLAQARTAALHTSAVQTTGCSTC